MKSLMTRRTAVAAVAGALLASGAAAHAAGPSVGATAPVAGADGGLVAGFSSVDRNTAWKQRRSSTWTSRPSTPRGWPSRRTTSSCRRWRSSSRRRSTPRPVDGYDRTRRQGRRPPVRDGPAGPPAEGHRARRGRHVPPRRHLLRRHEHLGPGRAVPARQQRDHLPGRRARQPGGAPSSSTSTTTSAASCATRPTATSSATTGARAASTSGRADGRQTDAWTNPQPLRRLPGLPVRRRRPRCSAAASPTCRRPRAPVAPGRRTSSAGWP